MDSDCTVNLVDEVNAPAVSAEIMHKLLSALATENAQTKNTAMTFEVRSSDQQLIGGLSMSTAYGWILIKTLWVAKDKQGSGLGRRLVNSAFDKGRELGCHGVWLDTSSASARDFYLHLGFKDFGALVNADDELPSSHRRWFMSRRL